MTPRFSSRTRNGCQNTNFLLASGDINVTAEFFETRLGFQVVAKYPDNGFLILKKGEAEIHFWTAESAALARSIAISSCVYIRVTNVGELFGEYKDRNVKFSYPLTVKPWGMNEFQVDDPFGNAIKFGEPTRPVA